MRFLHSLPNGALVNDTVGVTHVVHEEMARRGFPLTLGSVSSAIANLVASGRIQATFGHRSLDNKHLYTSVTVCAEPKNGITLAPSETPEHRSTRSESASLTNTETIEALLYRLGKRLNSNIKITNEDMSALQQHVLHLVEENRTWEMLASEAEEELSAERSMFAAKQDRLNKDISTQRERSEMYRKRWIAEQTRVAEAEKSVQTIKSTLSTLRRELDLVEERIKTIGRSRDIERARADALTAERGKEKKAAVNAVKLARRREDYLLEEWYFVLVDFVVDLVQILWNAGRQNFNVVIGDQALRSIDLLDSNGAHSDTVTLNRVALREFMQAVAKDSNAAVKSLTPTQKKRAAKTSVKASRLAAAHKELNEHVGRLVAPDIKGDRNVS
ncbi:MAG: hypothetical protein ACYDEP_02685 [Acidimicrobiales bacterium]